MSFPWAWVRHAVGSSDYVSCFFRPVQQVRHNAIKMLDPLYSLHEMKAESKKFLTKYFYSASSAKPFKKKDAHFQKLLCGCTVTVTRHIGTHSGASVIEVNIWWLGERVQLAFTQTTSAQFIQALWSFKHAQVPIKLGKCHKCDYVRYNSDWMSNKLEWKEIKSKYTGWSLSSINHFYSCRKTEPWNTEFLK